MTATHHAGSCQCGRMPDGTPMVAINLNCLDGVDARALPARHHDGAAT